MELTYYIRDQIRRNKEQALSFAAFMEMVLYHPDWGYYTAARVKVGKEGDFYTSATVHPVFAETLADVCIEMWAKTGMHAPGLVEIGGGTGYLMYHLLERIRLTAPDAYKNLHVYVIEASPYHRELQAQALSVHTCQKTWFHSLAEAEAALGATGIEGVVFSNEWLDAYPVHLLEKTRSGWIEIGVGWNEDQQTLHEHVLPALTPEAASFIEERQPKVMTGARIEANVAMKEGLRSVGKILRRGYVITIDYGDVEQYLYHPMRKRGTLMCYYRHQAHENPFEHIGEQDITAHVNFSCVMDWGKAVGLSTFAMMRQDQFLIKSGILNKLQDHQDRDPFTSEAMKRNRAIRQLIAPEGMGQTFQVLLQEKGITEVPAFSFLDT